MAKDKPTIPANKVPSKKWLHLQENDVTTEKLKDVFDHLSCKTFIEDDELYLDIDEINTPILVSINYGDKYISFSCVFDVSKTVPFLTKTLIINEVNNSIPFIKFTVPAEDAFNDCIYSVSDLGFIGGVSVIELERAANSFIAALKISLTDSELHKLNG